MHFYVADPYPNEKLRDITPLSARARSWLARVIVGIPENESIPTVGAVAMLEGLDYHNVQFMALFDRLGPYYSRIFGGIAGNAADRYSDVSPLLPTASEAAALDALNHEAVAYLNRLGQFFAYAKARGLAARLVRAGELMVFRHKHTAHRSIDIPRNETQLEQEYQAMAFGFYRLMRSGFPTYQIISGRKHHEFQMHRDHSIVMQEAIDALFNLYPPPNNA